MNAKGYDRITPRTALLDNIFNQSASPKSSNWPPQQRKNDFAPGVTSCMLTLLKVFHLIKNGIRMDHDRQQSTALHQI